ncbi:MAG: hypothetical protein JW795_19855 [Chitinivibrionales bacterium]|nr:hypothetical protein [Chitinivibrionales bacterium]
MKKKNLMDELNFLLANALKEKQIKMFEGRPYREQVICQDDIVNLKISLNCCKTWEEFLNSV